MFLSLDFIIHLIKHSVANMAVVRFNGTDIILFYN
jgi:hypothetical protein